MRIYLHDYGRYAFITDLGRALAARGHTVRLGYSATNLVPQDLLERRPGDPATFSVDPIAAPPVDKRARSVGGLVARRRSEAAYGRAAAEHVAAFGADVVLCANTPLDALGAVMGAARGSGAAFVNWLMDVLSTGARAVLAERFGRGGDLAGRAFEWREGRLLRAADAVVAITDDFRPLLDRWGVEARRVAVVENWAPLADLPARPKDNAWARAHGLAETPVVLYSGTLGMKHDPALLLALARRLEQTGADRKPADRKPAGRLVVVSEGDGADWLAARQAEGGAGALTLLPFQPFEAFPDVLGTGDVMAAVLEPGASAVSVPSKVLAYLCAGRPTVLSVPADNLAARTVVNAGAGETAPPGDAGAFADRVLALLADDGRRAAMGARARAYAEAAFDLDAVADRFEAVLADAVARRR
ncbi:glycosyltransferase [Rubrivirga sp. S365]|uniref:glycosyltransferase n=1 Tax=Rubrivirga sp. S365 TaxID=3076080 RepID=UPI0028C734DA|nr:glycosyltransferase [Rubrivirga sp. S365]MDT7857692.1 glycosyltransferase [Rubrivirga sp. S365]